MPREIEIPNLNKKIRKGAIDMAVNNNDDILLSFCKNKRPRYGKITMTGIEWNNWNDAFADADQTCHEFHQMIVFNINGKIIAPCHAHEVYELRINPRLNQPLE